jgi:hypothetical protein
MEIGTNVNLRDTKCKTPCTETTFMTTMKALPHDLKEYAILYLYYQTNEVDLHEEYLIFDFSSILTAVGGSLGLFLGFSFFQCGNLIMQNMLKLCKIVARKIYPS